MFRFMPKTAWHHGRGWDFQIWRLASQAHYGGGHLNEIARTVEKLIPDDGNSWYREWHGIGDELSRLAADASTRGHRKTAADRLFRVSNYYRMADFFLKIDDDRKLVTAQKSVAAFLGGLRESDRPVKPVRVPYENTTLKGYWCRPSGGVTVTARAIVLIGGLNSTAEELYFTAYGLIERGFHILIIEGPGQGTVLREQKLTSRFDYEVVGTVAYDWVRALPEMANGPIALIGMSLGGYYSLRIACFEHRFSALVSWSPIENYGEFWKDRPDNHNLAPHVQWVLGAASMTQAREIMNCFDVGPFVDKITCPTLLCVAEHDGSPLSLQQSKSVFEKLKCPKTWHYFTEQTGGSLHCQQDHLTLANEVIGDWLDETLAKIR